MIALSNEAPRVITDQIENDLWDLGQFRRKIYPAQEEALSAIRKAKASFDRRYASTALQKNLSNCAPQVLPPPDEKTIK